MFKCDVCNKEFDSYRKLNGHKSIHKEDSRYSKSRIGGNYANGRNLKLQRSCIICGNATTNAKYCSLNCSSISRKSENHILDDDGKLRKRYIARKANAVRYGIGFNLSFEQYCALLEEKNLKSSDVGKAKYHLSRDGDIGPYEIGNCHFKWFTENLKEKNDRLFNMPN